MAAKKRRRRAKPRKNPIRRRRNPSRARRVVRRAKSTFAGLDIMGALKDQIPIQLGMLGTKWFSKLWGPDATEGDPSSWNWSSYAKGGLGAVATAFVIQMIKPKLAKKVLQGGLSLIFYKLVQNQLISGNEWAEEHFGAEDEAGSYIPDEFDDQLDRMQGYQPGDVETDAAGTAYLLGDNYQWQPLPEDNVMGGNALRPVGPLGSYEHLSPPGPLGGDERVATAILGS